MSNPLTDIFTGGLSGLTDSVKGILDKFITDPKDKLAAQLQVETMAHDLEVQTLKAGSDFAVQQASVVIAEAKGESWMQRNWRPILMLSFVAIIDFNFILAPIINMFASGKLKALDIPTQMWGLITLGVSGYIGARSWEKVTDTKATRDLAVANVQAKAAA
jgi:hypothetical protein